MDALQSYLELERGRKVRLANALGISPGAISQWDRVPIERVAEVEKVTGISRNQLRPDIFGSGGARAPFPKKSALVKPRADETVTKAIIPKSIAGCMKGMVTFPDDFNPAEPFWGLYEDEIDVPENVLPEKGR